jgi:hypothetical protein
MRGFTAVGSGDGFAFSYGQTMTFAHHLTGR